MKAIVNLLVLVAVLLSFHSQAAIETYTNRISGGTIATNAQFSVFDGQFSTMYTNPNWNTLFSNYQIKNKLQLGINPAVLQNNALSGGVTVSIKTWTWNPSTLVFDVVTTSSINLAVDYSMTESTIINELSTYSFTGVSKFEVTVSSVNGGASFDVNDVYLEATVEVERYYTFSGTAPGSVSATQSTNFIDFEWAQVDGAELYELEYVHINDYKVLNNTSFLATSQLKFDFYKNSTRVIINTPYYRIPNVFDHGYLVYRVRAIGLVGSTFTIRKEGSWNVQESGLISSLSLTSNYIAINFSNPSSPAYDYGMNWGYQAAIADDGKRFEGISYVDALGRARQTIGRNTETDQVIVSNVYYDGYGRPTITDLPTPVDEQSLAHRQNFNKADGDTYYGAAHIDQIYIANDPNCSFVTIPFSQNDGAGKYYSANNPDKDAENVRIPDAQKYPFARVEYMDDQTGRIRRVGGVGPDFQIASGKETEFYYGTPSQFELDRLFGSEVGYNTHYQKRVTVDANDQAYVEYFDMAGRVIATGMQGEKPDPLDQLSNNVTTNETQIITQGLNGTVTPTSMTLSQPLIVTDAYDYVFNYSLNPANYEDALCLANICFDCVYKLTIKITDVECGIEKYNQSFTINGATYDAACNGIVTFNSNPTIPLTEGVYTITKTLEVDQTAIDQYWCTYVDNNTCIDSYADQFNELYNAADFSSCDNVIDYSVEDDDCSAITPFLLGDVSPGGQYASYTVSGAAYSSTDPISVLNPSNTVYSGHYWKNPYFDYEYPVGVTAYVEVTLVSPGVYDPPVSGTTPILVSGNTYKVKPQYLVNLKDFVERFKDSWAYSLLEAHPEYCYYQFCELNAASQAYDNAMEETSTFSQACSAGYFKPMGVVTTTTLGYFTGCASSADPFFQGSGSSYATAAQAQMNNYITIDGLSLSMWDYAVLLSECPNETTSVDIIACIRNKEFCADDAIWLNFRDMYLEMKQAYYAQAEEDYVTNTAGCSPYADEVGESGNPFSNSTPRFDYYMDQASSTPNSATVGSINSSAAATCQAISTTYVEQWLNNLSYCPTLPAVGTTAYNNLKADLIALCSYGCTAEHPAGATTLPAVISPSPFVLPSGQNLYGGATINSVLALYGISESTLCTELLISDPGPYKENLAENIYLDNCGCDVLLATKQQWDSNTDIPAGVTTIEELLAYNTGISLEDAEGLMCHCDKVASDWTPAYTWSTTQIENLLALEEIVTAELTCPQACLSCTDVNNGVQAIITRFGASVADDENYTTLLTNYLNTLYDFDLTYSHYYGFLMQCSGSEVLPYCTATGELLDFAEVMNLIANRGQLLTGSAAPLDLVTQNIVYKKSDLRKATNYTNYSAAVSGNQLTITFWKGETAVSCATTLTIPDGAGFTFADIIGFGQIISTNGTCATDANTFTIETRYVECGEIKTASISGSTDCFDVQNCYCNEGTLCNIPISEQLGNQQPCFEPILSQLYQQAEMNYNDVIDAAKQEFITNYNSQCDDVFPTELYTVYGPFNQYQYTLFYYDQAGNLVKTVAPKGVTLVPNAQLAAVANSRNTTTDIDNQALAVLPPNQAFKTEYVYNSYNQAVSTSNPDQEGATQYWYDRYSRIVASQNPVQADLNKYSYVFYDNLGRPIETGQVVKSGGLSESIVKANDLGLSFANWVTSVSRTEVTYTQYDDYISGVVSSKFAVGSQQNLRLRVASVLYFNTVDNNTIYQEDYSNATHYSYDLHGNVIEALQDVPMTELVQVGQDVKSTQYSFELFSGNVKKVEYQKGKLDRMTHEYHYDKLNRLTEVWTSRDGEIHKSREAHYRYFDYGPLARVEIGHHKVQGNDYAYTLQGWLKSINGSTLNRSRDGGRDGNYGYMAGNPSVNSEFAPDLTGFTLGYYLNDYKSIGVTSFLATTGTSGNAAVDAVATKQLYNGNIAYTTTAINGFLNSATVYTYDQLNRIKASKMYGLNSVDNLNSWSGSVAWTAYETAYTYDENGNLNTLMRNGNTGGALLMDQFSYNYGTGSNRLTYVTDAATNGGSYTTDIDNGQTGTTTAFGSANVIGAVSGNNYKYDKIGQLVEDVQEQYRYEWRAGDKKLKTQTPINTSGTKDLLEFVYNPLGQRILKIAKTVTNGVLQPNSGGTAYRYTYYAYDANGQVMATYKITNTTALKQAQVDEHSIYGAGRLGLIQEEGSVYLYNQGAVSMPGNGSVWTNRLGKKNYELTNHLGNVHAIITDRKMMDADGQAIGINYDFTSYNPTWNVSSPAPTLTLNSGQLVVASSTAVGGTIWRTESVTQNINYTFTVDVTNTTIADLKLELYTSTNATLPSSGAMATFTNLGSGTITYQFTVPAGHTNFFYKFVKTSTEVTNYKLDNLTLNRINAKYKAVVMMKADYYPFGMQMEGSARSYVASGFGGYRFGYNGMEVDPETKGNGNSYTTEFRQYDPRLGRWLSLDPLMAKYSNMSPYCAFNNNPVYFVDPEGLEGGPAREDLLGKMNSKKEEKPKPKEYSGFTKFWNLMAGDRHKNFANEHAVKAGTHARGVFDGNIYIVLDKKNGSKAYIDATLEDDNINVTDVKIRTKEDFLFDKIKELLSDDPLVFAMIFEYTGDEEIFDDDGNSFIVSYTWEEPVRIMEARFRIRFRIGTKNGVYAKFRNRRTGKQLPYIGKSFNISTRYSGYERLASGLRTIVSNVKDKNLLRAIEQRMQDYLSVEKNVPIDNMRRAMNLKDYAKYKDLVDEALKDFDWKGALDEMFGL